MIFTADRILYFIKSLNDPNIEYIKTDSIKHRTNLIVNYLGWRGLSDDIDLSNLHLFSFKTSNYLN
jgi:hypothetical protein